jgi:hypothetical protein
MGWSSVITGLTLENTQIADNVKLEHISSEDSLAK